MNGRSKMVGGLKRGGVGLIVGAMLAGGVALGGVTTAANAAEWKVVSTKSGCSVISGWRDCYTETTWRRTSQFCAKPAGNLTGGLLAWYSYCYKTTKVRD